MKCRQTNGSKQKGFLLPRVSDKLQLLAGCLCFSLAMSGAEETRPNPTPAPAARVDLSLIGYRPFSRMARLAYPASASVNFVDAEHVLLTFNRKKLVHRDPACSSDHDDWLLHAAILELPSGKIVRESDWYLHDRRRYLWPLGPGKFLLRKLNSLYVVDSTLQERLLMSSHKDLLWVEVTPDGKQIIVETKNDGSNANTPDGSASGSHAVKDSKHPYLVEFLDAESLAQQRTIMIDKRVDLEGTSRGFADVIRLSAFVWLIRFGPSPSERRNIAVVRARTMPRVVHPSDNSLLIGRCLKSDCQYSVTAFSLVGNRLWKQHWSQARYYPAISRNRDGSRFAISTLRNIPDPPGPASAQSPAEAADEEDRKEGIEEDVQVLDTASGTRILSLDIRPALLSGQNFALSPDGTSLAVLHDSSLELYGLPMMSSEEQAKSEALRADAPDLYLLPTGAEGGTGQEPSVQAEASPDVEEELPSFAAPDFENADPEGDDAGRKTAPQSATTNTLPATATTADAKALNESVPVFRATSRAVVVDIVVTDAQGKSVRGIPQGDFEVAEDGKLQNIRSFREVNEDDPPTRAKPVPTTVKKATPNIFSNDTAATGTGVITVILFDLLNTPTADQPYAREQLRKFVKEQARGRPYAVCVLGQDGGLRMVQGLTADEDALLVAIGKPLMPVNSRAEINATLDRGAANSMMGFATHPNKGDNWQQNLTGLEQAQAERQVMEGQARAMSTLGAMEHVARYLAGLPGRKNVVWISGSFPLSFVAQVSANGSLFETRSYADKVKEVTNLLAEKQIAIYPVDTAGVATSGDGAVERVAAPASQSLLPQVGTPRGSGPGRAMSQTSLDDLLDQTRAAASSAKANSRDTQKQLAADTGGMAFFNSNAIDTAIAKAVEQGSHYYSVSYRPSNENYNGKFRKIKVNLTRKGDQLRYRSGYYAKQSFEAATQNLIGPSAAMQSGSPLAHEIRFAVRAVPVGKKKAGMVQISAGPDRKNLPSPADVQHYIVDYAVDGSSLRFVPAANGVRHAAMNIFVSTYASDGRRLSSMGGTWTDDLNPDAFKNALNGGLRMHQELDVPAKAASLRIGLQDNRSDHWGTIELPLPLPPASDVPRLHKHAIPEVEAD